MHRVYSVLEHQNVFARYHRHGQSAAKCIVGLYQETEAYRLRLFQYRQCQGIFGVRQTVEHGVVVTGLQSLPKSKLDFARP